ncbi:MAG TPA: pyroglutamyl-peptidase I, partial [Nitrobacter sp.]|nr:pyroglutamyl-peptidase I [Nitrobacter sp.]
THRRAGPCLAAFVHVPPLRRDGSARAPGGITLDHLADAGEAMLLEMVKATRQAGLTSILRPDPL